MRLRIPRRRASRYSILTRRSLGVERDDDCPLTAPALDLDPSCDEARQQVTAMTAERFGVGVGFRGYHESSLGVRRCFRSRRTAREPEKRSRSTHEPRSENTCALAAFLPQ